MDNHEYLNLINIFVLEYLLYSKALLEYNIVMLYRDYDWNNYKNLMDEYNIDVVFDCTGGRLKTDIFNNIITNDKEGSEKAFEQVIQDKLRDALEIRKVGITSEIFNKQEEK